MDFSFLGAQTLSKCKESCHASQNSCSLETNVLLVLENTLQRSLNLTWKCLTYCILDYYLGATRQQFENFIRTSVGGLVPRWPDPDREEDVVQAGLFQYTPWPYKNRRLANRDQIGHVSACVAKQRGKSPNTFYTLFWGVWGYVMLIYSELDITSDFHKILDVLHLISKCS